MCLWDVLVRSDSQPSRSESAWTRLGELLADEAERFEQWELEISVDEERLELTGYAVLRLEARDPAEAAVAVRSLLSKAGLGEDADAHMRDTCGLALDTSPANRPWVEALDAMESQLDPNT